MNFHKCAIFLFISVLIAGSVNINAHVQKNIESNRWYVGGAGSNNLTSISEALVYASNGDILLVYPGTYIESVVVNVSVNLIGLQGYNDTIIDGSHKSPPLIVNANNCYISGFTFINPGDNFKNIACVSLKSSFCNFSNNLVLMKKVYHADTKSAVEVTEGHSNILYNNKTFADLG
jgi:hypothetical protein